MASVNKVILLGNLGRDPEVRYTPSGDAVVSMSIATTETWKDKGGQRQDKTEWHNVVMYRRLAEIAGEYLKKGSQVYIEGRLQTRKWQDKQGNDRYTTEIAADHMQMLGQRDSGGASDRRGGGRHDYHPAGGGHGDARESPRQRQQGDARQPPAGNFDDMDDDIPF